MYAFMLNKYFFITAILLHMLVLSVSKRICNVNAPLRVVMHTLNSFSMKHCQFYLALYLKRKGESIFVRVVLSDCSYNNMYQMPICYPIST